MSARKRHETLVDNARQWSDDLVHAGRNVWLAGLGAVALVELETRDAFKRLVDEGEKFRGSDRNVLGKAVERAAERAKELGRRLEDGVQGTFTSTLHRAGVPSRDEIHELIDRVEVLAEKVEGLRVASSEHRPVG